MSSLEKDSSAMEEYLCRLQNVLESAYSIRVSNMKPAKRGYYAETWRVWDGAQSYFLKIDHLPFHHERFLSGLAVVEYLWDQGIRFAGKLILTKQKKRYAVFDQAVLALFAWIDGENIETDQTKKAEYEMLSQVYVLTKPGLPIPTASFTLDAAVRFYRQWETLRTSGRQEDHLIVSVLDRYEKSISHNAARLELFSRRCLDDTGDFYLTHGDAGGNFFVGGGRTYLLDWDEAMYAPPERDAWVMGCYEWARELFCDTLKNYHISYRLRPDRLAFYCYHMYFHYLCEFLSTQPYEDKSGRIQDYLENGWIQSRVWFADSL